jgi:hypothetical protein
MKEISLTQGKIALVDDEDFNKFNKYRWYFSHGYARRCKDGIKIYLHREINNTPVGLITDHINRNTLDNRKFNLRTVKKIDNQRNHKILKNNTSGYNGISWSKTMKKWEVYLWLKNKKINIGYFFDIKLAIKQRKLAELKYWI